MEKRSSSGGILAIPLGKIKMAPSRPRIDEDHALMIAASMAALGPVTPIEVRGPDRNGRYLLVAGHHRYRAAQLIGLEFLPAIIRDPPERNGPSDRTILATADAVEECLSGSGGAPARMGEWNGEFSIRPE